MKARYSKAICFILMLILLFSGLCTEEIQAASGQQYVESQQRVDSIQKKGVDFSYGEGCTRELLSGMQQTLLPRQQANSRLYTKMAMPLLNTEKPSPHFLAYLMGIFLLGNCVSDRDTRILNYIHKQDGKK